VDVIVVGGGVVGCAAAYFLAREGRAVALLERDAIAARASNAAAGMLLPSGEASGAGALYALGRRSLALFPELVAELHTCTGIDAGYEPSGALHVATTGRFALALRARAEAFSADGVVWLDANAARAEEPQLGENALGAMWSPAEGHVRSASFARALAAGAARLGASIEVGVAVRGLLRERERVVGVETTAGQRSAPLVVVCAGAWTPELSGWLRHGSDPPSGCLHSIEPVRGQILSLSPGSLTLRAILGGEEVYLVPRRDGRVLVGATEEHEGFDCRVTAAGVATLLLRAIQLVPALADATFCGARAGLRPATPDGLPLIGPVPGVPGLVVCAGHSRNGVLLAPLTGTLIAELAAGKSLPAYANALRPDRFPSGR